MLTLAARCPRTGLREILLLVGAAILFALCAGQGAGKNCLLDAGGDAAEEMPLAPLGGEPDSPGEEEDLDPETDDYVAHSVDRFSKPERNGLAAESLSASPPMLVLDVPSPIPI